MEVELTKAGIREAQGFLADYVMSLPIEEYGVITAGREPIESPSDRDLVLVLMAHRAMDTESKTQEWYNGILQRVVRRMCGFDE